MEALDAVEMVIVGGWVRPNAVETDGAALWRAERVHTTRWRCQIRAGRGGRRGQMETHGSQARDTGRRGRTATSTADPSTGSSSVKG